MHEGKEKRYKRRKTRKIIEAREERDERKLQCESNYRKVRSLEVQRERKPNFARKGKVKGSEGKKAKQEKINWR